MASSKSPWSFSDPSLPLGCDCGNSQGSGSETIAHISNVVGDLIWRRSGNISPSTGVGNITTKNMFSPDVSTLKGFAISQHIQEFYLQKGIKYGPLAGMAPF